MHVRLRIYCTMKYLTSLCQNYKDWKLWKLHFTMQPRMKWVYSNLIFFWILSGLSSVTLFYLFIQVVIHTIRLPKQSTVGDVLNDLKTKVIVHEYYLVHQHLNCTLTLNWNNNYNQRELMSSFAFKTKDTWSHVCRFCSVLHLVIEVINF